MSFNDGKRQMASANDQLPKGAPSGIPSSPLLLSSKLQSPAPVDDSNASKLEKISPNAQDLDSSQPKSNRVSQHAYSKSWAPITDAMRTVVTAKSSSPSHQDFDAIRTDIPLLQEAYLSKSPIPTDTPSFPNRSQYTSATSNTNFPNTYNRPPIRRAGGSYDYANSPQMFPNYSSSPFKPPTSPTRSFLTNLRSVRRHESDINKPRNNGVGHGSKHVRTASAAAISALQNLRANLKAAGISTKGVRRAKRRQVLPTGEQAALIKWQPPFTNFFSLVSIWFKQVDALVRKHFIAASRESYVLIIFAIFGPFLALFLASALNKALSNALGKAIFFTSINTNDAVAPFNLKWPSCSKSAYYCTPMIFYSPQTPNTKAIMNELGNIIGLDMDQDVFGFPSLSTCMDKYYLNSRQLQRRTRHYSIHFTSEEDSSSSNSTTYYYTIGEGDGNTIGSFYDTLLPRSYSLTKGSFLAVRLALDNAILNVMAGNNVHHSIDTSVSIFPRVIVLEPTELSAENSTSTKSDSSDASVDGLQISSSLTHYASNVLTIPILAAGVFPMMILIANTIGQDKFRGSLGQLRHINLFESAYWVSVAVFTIILNAIASVFVFIPAKFSGYSALVQIDLSLIFTTFFMYGVAMCAVGGMLLSVAVVATSYVASIISVLLTVVSSLLLLILNVVDLNQLNFGSKFVPWWDRFAPVGLSDSYPAHGATAFYIASFLPFFHLGRLVGFMTDYTWGGYNGKGAASVAADQSSKLYSSSSIQTSSTLEDYPYPLEMQNVIFPLHQTIPSSLLALAALIVASLVACWYFNQIITTSHHWKRPWYFLFTSRYWKNGRARSRNDKSYVELSQVVQVLGKKQILDGVSLRLERGTVTALLGHNGAGKSTLLDVLTGSARAKSQGDSHIFGVALGCHSARSQIGICPQNDVVWSALTAREHVKIWARFRGHPSKTLDAYADAILATVSLNLPELRNRPVRKYSGGMLRRLSLVSAYVGNPRLVIIDEGSNGLDPIHRRHVWEFIAMLASQGAAVLLTSHSAQEVNALADDVVVLAVPQIGKGARVVLQRNLLELRKEQSITDVRVTLPDPENVLKYMPSEVILSHRTVAPNAAVVSFPAGKLADLAYSLESPPIIDWELHPSFDMLLPPQPGTELAGGAVSVEASETLDYDALQMLHRSKPPSTGISRVVYQISGMLYKNLQLQVLANIKYNILFLILFVGVVVGLALLMKNSGQTTCPYDSTVEGDRYVGHNPFNIPGRYPTQKSCDAGVLKSAANVSFNFCNKDTSLACSVPDYAAFKQTRYQALVDPQIWAHAPFELRTHMSSQTTKSALPDIDATSLQIQGAVLSRFLNQTPQDTILMGLIDTYNRPVNITYPEGTMDDWISKIRNTQASALNSDRKVPKNCVPLIRDRVKSGVYGLPPTTNSMRQAEAELVAQFPDFAIDVDPGLENSSGRKIKVGVHYWAMTRYALASFLYNVDGPCDIMEVFPSNENLAPIDASITDPSPPPGQFAYQSQWPLSKLDSTKNKLEELWLLDGPIRQITSSIFVSLARMLVNPNARIYGEMIRITDLQYSLRDEMLLACIVCALLWLFFPIFLRIPMTEQTGRYLAYYRVNGLSIFSYWVAHYLYCIIYAIPFLFALGLALCLIYPFIYPGFLSLTFLLGIHAIIGLSFLYGAIAVFFSSNRGGGGHGAGARDGGGDDGSGAVAMFLAYLVPILVGLPSVLAVYSDVISLSISQTSSSIAFPGIGIAFALRIVIQGFDYEYLQICFGWLFGIGLICLALSVFLCALADLNWKVVQGNFEKLLPRRKRRGTQAESLRTASIRTVTSTRYPPSVSPFRTDDYESLSSDSRRDVTGLPSTQEEGRPYVANSGSPVFFMPAQPPQGSCNGPSRSTRRRAHKKKESICSVVTVDSNVAAEASRVSSGPNYQSSAKLVHVTKKYQGQAAPVVDDISLGVQAQECFGLLGPNGCGKTHTINLITGQMKPTSGKVEMGGSVGLCPQDNYLLSELSVFDNLRFYAQVKGLSFVSAGHAARVVSRLVGLDAFLRQLIRNLSGGMKRRVMLAVALIGNPSILICDEPSTALDVHHQRNLWNILAQLRDGQKALQASTRNGSGNQGTRPSGLSIILVSHYMEEVQALCHRMAIMAKGSIKCIGTPAQLKRKYGDGWRLVLQCPREAVHRTRDWVGTLPAVVCACFLHFPFVTAVISEGMLSTPSSALNVPPLPSAVVASDSPDLTNSSSTLYDQAAGVNGQSRGSPDKSAVAPFEMPQVIETTRSGSIPEFVDRVKLEFVIPRVRVLENTQTNPDVGPGAALRALFNAVKAESKSVGVTEYSIDTCSLEDVFLRVTTGSISC